jgi:transposase
MRRRTFSREYKIEAVKLVTERGVSVAQACRDLDVAATLLFEIRNRSRQNDAFPRVGR